MLDAPDAAHEPLSVSVVIPVYSGSVTLPGLVEELEALTHETKTPNGRPFRVHEVLLVWDRGPGGSDDEPRGLRSRHAG